MKWLGVCCLFFLPFTTFAQVSINEVAWMGSTDSANHEWIELYNNGSAVDVTGWVLNDGMNLAINLTGTIPANNYAVLERTSDDAAPGSAFFIYTGALVNTGATLKLLRADGSLVDQVSGGENWSTIGGDNVTKETAQYTTSGWITAQATPGKTNKTVGTVVETTTSVNTTSVTANSNGVGVKRSTSEPVKLELPDVTLKLAIKAQSLGYVNQKINFKVLPSGIGDSLIDSLLYQWNFGDGEVATQVETIHAFSYPGTYVVTVYGGFKRQEQVARHEITILPVMISLTTNQAGDVQINNDSPYEIDISHYRLVGAKEFEFPSYSVMLPNQTITITRQKIGDINKNMVAFYDAKGVSVTSIFPEQLKLNYLSVANKEETPFTNTTSVSNNYSPVNNTARFNFTNEPVESEETVLLETTLNDEETLVTQAASVIESSSTTNERYAYIGLIVLLVIAVSALYAVPKRSE